MGVRLCRVQRDLRVTAGEHDRDCDGQGDKAHE